MPKSSALAPFVFCGSLLLLGGCGNRGTVGIELPDAAAGDGGALDGASDTGPSPDAGPIDPCGNGIDDDLDGTIDENCPCTPSEMQACFRGAIASRNVGICRNGLQVCEASFEFGRWGACSGDTLPGTETCNGLDDDCDGAADETCTCASGDVRVCGAEYGSTGVCRAGTQRCEAGSWLSCSGAVGPSSEVCGDGLDNDCDAMTDEGCGCVPVPEVCGDGVDDDCDGRPDDGCPLECDTELPVWAPTMTPAACVGTPGGDLPIWAKSFGNTLSPALGSLYVQDMAVDPCGEITVTGLFIRPIDFDLGDGVERRSPRGNWEAFVARYSPDGALRWIRVMRSLAPIVGYETVNPFALAIDPERNVYVTGRFATRVDFDDDVAHADDTVEANGVVWTDGFVVKYQADGTFAWVATFGGTNTDDSNAITADGYGSVYVTGTAWPDADFDPLHVRGDDTIVYDKPYAGFVLKLDTEGAFQWVREFDSSGQDWGRSVYVDPADGDVFVTGHFGGNSPAYAAMFPDMRLNDADFISPCGTIRLTSKGYYDGFVAKLDRRGEWLWAQRFGTSDDPGPWDDDDGRKLVGDGDHVWLVGHVGKSHADFEIGTRRVIEDDAEVPPRLFAARLSDAGEIDSFYYTDGMGAAQPVTAFMSGDELVVVGGLYGDADFDPGVGETRASASIETGDRYRVHVSRAGALVEVVHELSVGTEYLTAASADAHGHVYVGTNVVTSGGGTIDLGSEVRSVPNGTFLAKILVD